MLGTQNTVRKAFGLVEVVFIVIVLGIITMVIVSELRTPTWTNASGQTVRVGDVIRAEPIPDRPSSFFEAGIDYEVTKIEGHYPNIRVTFKSSKHPTEISFSSGWLEDEQKRVKLVSSKSTDFDSAANALQVGDYIMITARSKKGLPLKDGPYLIMSIGEKLIELGSPQDEGKASRTLQDREEFNFNFLRLKITKEEALRAQH